MSNEILLIISLVFLYSSVLLWYRFIGVKGLYCFSVLATITANIEVLILIKAFGMEQTLGNVMFATTFLITDIVSELYSKKEAKKVVNINILTSIAFVVVSQIWIRFTPSSNDVNYDLIKGLFSSTPRLILASLVVYAIVQKIDVSLYHKIWSITEKLFKDKNKYLFIRNNGSTLISQLVNTILYNVLAFAGVYDTKTLISIVITSYVIFVFTSLCDTPFVYFARKIKTKYKIDEQAV